LIAEPQRFRLPHDDYREVELLNTSEVRLLRRLKSKHLHVEHERRAARNFRRRSTITVAHGSRDFQLALLTHAHAGHANIPALDDVARAEHELRTEGVSGNVASPSAGRSLIGGEEAAYYKIAARAVPPTEGYTRAYGSSSSTAPSAPQTGRPCHTTRRTAHRRPAACRGSAPSPTSTGVSVAARSARARGNPAGN